MRPIPVVFHLGPLQVHTYGIGLAITFWFAYRYMARRMRRHGYGDQWVASVAVWVIVAAVVGARVVHVVANWSSYAADPLQIPQVWNGGLSSFGGLLFGVPTGFLLAKHRLPGASLARLADIAAPVLLASWALGRLLGPQLMVAGGGHPTHQWFGLYYAGQVGRRLPVPIFQAVLSFVALLIVWRVERWVEGRGGPTGLVIASAAGLWGTSRFFEEHLWLSYPGHLGALAVQAGALALAAAGAAAAAALLVRDRHRATGAAPPGGHDAVEVGVAGTTVDPEADRGAPAAVPPSGHPAPTTDQASTAPTA